MIKKTIYPKTPRIVIGKNPVTITEKLDGSNLVIFKKDSKLFFAQRNNILEAQELTKQLAYKGLVGWVEKNGKLLEAELIEGAAVCGEWVGMGSIKYGEEALDKKFYMFAKANVNDDFQLYNIRYDHSLFVYPFEGQSIPECIGTVSIVEQTDCIPSIEHLDEIYADFCQKVGRSVEGFVIEHGNVISKYVRMKNGGLKKYEENPYEMKEEA